jgi:deazaflavin-dependent oxidoreductase (nitroreductase family)
MTQPAPEDFNSRIVEEFRANGGKVGAPFEGATMIILHHKGAKTGAERINPLVYQPVGDDFAIFASKGGAPSDPQWYRNLLAHPETSVEIGSETYRVRARVLGDDEREPIWEKQKQVMPGFAEYEAKTKGVRMIPVVLLERI